MSITSSSSYSPPKLGAINTRSPIGQPYPADYIDSDGDSCWTERTQHILDRPDDQKSVFQCARRSHDAFRSIYNHVPEVHDLTLAMPHDRSFANDLGFEAGDPDFLSSMVKRNPIGMELLSGYIGDQTVKYLDELSAVEPDILPASCLSASANMIDIACGTAGFLQASRSHNKLGIDYDNNLLNAAVKWQRGSFDDDTLRYIYLSFDDVAKEHSDLIGSADFIHLGAPPVCFESTSDADGFVKSFHCMLKKDDDNARAFLGLPVGGISTGRDLRESDEIEPAFDNKYFVQAINKYFKILHSAEAGESDSTDSARLIGDAFAQGIILKPKTDIEIATQQFERLGT